MHFGIQASLAYKHIICMQKLSLCVSLNAWCSFVTDRWRQMGVDAITGMTPKTHKLKTMSCSCWLGARKGVHAVRMHHTSNREGKGVPVPSNFLIRFVMN